MSGIAGYIHLNNEPLTNGNKYLDVMNHLQRHRGPDGCGVWLHNNKHVGLAHCSLNTTDLSTSANQPMADNAGNWITFDGAIYNCSELREELGADKFRTRADSEVVLHAWRKWGEDCVNHFRGMFAFALWDESTSTLFCARDRFGIKPLYYCTVGSFFYFASEAKALLPFLDSIQTDLEGFKDYLAFQFCLNGKTLFKDIKELLPAHTVSVAKGILSIRHYWEVFYDLDFNHTPKYFEQHLRELLIDSVSCHLHSHVPFGAYVSGGLDSSTIASIACNELSTSIIGFIGKFKAGPEYDESQYAHALSQHCDFPLYEKEITSNDFIQNIQSVIYHLDYPVAGPGSFSQYMVSALAAKQRRVVLGGQGGDEIFGGYTRYLIAYFEQCIKAAINGTAQAGNFIVTYESIIPNLTALKQYTPLLQEFWREGLFEEMDQRYFRLINRAPHLGAEVRWEQLGEYSPYETFRSIFISDNVDKHSYFDLMTHFDFKTQLPALLHVEDRVSMAHGLESRVPLLDHPLVEFAATIPADSKFCNGEMKHIFKKAIKPYLPEKIYNRTDKMGFPTPFNQWLKKDAHVFIKDTMTSHAALNRALIDNGLVMNKATTETKFGRNVWGFLSLELWQQTFHDKQSEYKKLLQEELP